MTGVPRLGSGGLSPGASPQARALAGDLDHLGMQVTPGNVLQVRNAVAGEATRLHDLLTRHNDSLTVRPHAADPVSQAAAPLFNQKIDGLKAQMWEYVNTLHRAGQALEQTAVSYGHQEQLVKDSFNSYIATQKPVWQQQAKDRDALQSLPEPMRELVQPSPPSPHTGTSLPGMFGAAS